MKISHKQAKALGIKAPKKKRVNRAFGSDGKKAKVQSQYGKADGNEGRDRLFDAMCVSHGLPVPVHEYPFHDTRNWRFDYLFDGWLVLEKQGGNWIGGRHTNAAALIAEYEKVNEAVIAGYSVMFCTPEDIESGAIFPLLKRAIDSKATT